jgi:phosphatidylglycerophosphate synthase
MTGMPPTVYPLGRKVAAYAVLGALIAAAAGGVVGHLYNLSPFAAPMSAAVVLIMFAASEPARRRVMPPRFGPANRVTLARGILVGVVAAFIGTQVSPALTFGVAAFAALALMMDGLDGYVARKTGLSSPYGAQLDMEMDSLLMMVLSILAWQWDRAGVWVLFCGLVRYAFVGFSLIFPWLNRPLYPAFRRKTACVIGIGGLLAAIVPWPWAGTSWALAASATLALALSFALDIRWLFQRRHHDRVDIP